MSYQKTDEDFACDEISMNVENLLSLEDWLIKLEKYGSWTTKATEWRASKIKIWGDERKKLAAEGKFTTSKKLAIKMLRAYNLKHNTY